MAKVQTDKESWFLLGLIAFGLIATLFIEISGIKHRPIILLIFIGLSATALMYKLLGGIENSAFSTPVFKLSGSAAFLFAFISLINPILEKQTFPEKDALFKPSHDNWIAINKSNLEPISLKVNLLDYEIDANEFPEFDADKRLSVKAQNNQFQVFTDTTQKWQLGVFTSSEIASDLERMNTAKIKKTHDEVFPKNIGLGELTPSRKWFPYRIRPTHFDSDVTSYEIIKLSGNQEELKVADDILLRGSKLHTIDNDQYLITIHRVDHIGPDTWARFAVAKLVISK